jgi:putative toxin-antitoxin system antitoxin component (TIGR02293 family)
MTPALKTPPLLEHTILEAHDHTSGRYHALRLATLLAISVEEMAQVLGVSGRGLRKNPDSPKLQARLARMVQVVQNTRDLFQGSLEYARIWLKSPHPALDGQSPFALIQQGNLEAVEDLLEMIQRGQPA